jgi:hypothetical protein
MYDDAVRVGQNEGQYVHATVLILETIAQRQKWSFGFQWVWYGEIASSSFSFCCDFCVFSTYSMSHPEENGFEAFFCSF